MEECLITKTEIIPLTQIKLIQRKWFLGKCFDIHLKSAPFDRIKVITIWKCFDRKDYDKIEELFTPKENQ